MEDITKLKILLDTIETYIYSIPGISEEYELPDRAFIKHGENASLDWQRFQLEQLQGAYLMIVLQYWTGNPIARARVRQQRYGRVVAVCVKKFVRASLIGVDYASLRNADCPAFARYGDQRPAVVSKLGTERIIHSVRALRKPSYLSIYF